MNDLIPYLGQLAGLFEIAVLPFVGLLARLSGLFLLMPGIGMRIIPTQLRVMLVLAIAFLLLPTAIPFYETDAHPVPLMIGEVTIGIFYGLVVRFFIFVLSIAGAIIAQSLSLSQIFGAGVSEEANTTVSSILTTAGAVLFLSLGLHIQAISILIESLTTFRPAEGLQASDIGGFTQLILKFSGEAMALALSLSLPFLLMNLAYNALLGVLNRAMPQLMVTFVGLPAITLSGLTLLMVSIGAMLTIWLEALKQHLGGFLP